MNKIIISPVTRLSGFYKIEITIDDKNIVIDANSSGTLFRGFESMLSGRPPQDSIYYTQRICGICSTSHSIAASRAVESASKIKVDKNAEIIRDLIHGFDILQNHLRSFYLFTIPDFINIPNADSLITDDYRVPEVLSRQIQSNYIKSLDLSRLAHEGVSLFGGKAPHNHGIVFGGVSSEINPLFIGRAVEILKSIKSFVVNSMIPDYLIIEKYYSDYLDIGQTYNNFMSYGLFNEFPEAEISPPMVVIGGRMGLPNYENIIEDISNINPAADISYKYNFIKAPRYHNHPMEVGPLARAVIRGENLKSSTMNRIKARVYETLLLCKSIEYFINKLSNGRNYAEVLISDGSGTGYVDTVRGSLLHHVEITDKKISKYDIITPSAWNLSPKDSKNIPGPLETSLIGTRLKNPEKPIEIIRTIHSYDPCISCATHIYSRNGEMINVFDYMPW